MFESLVQPDVKPEQTRASAHAVGGGQCPPRTISLEGYAVQPLQEQPGKACMCAYGPETCRRPKHLHEKMLRNIRVRLSFGKVELLQVAGRVCARTRAGVPGDGDGLRATHRHLPKSAVTCERERKRYSLCIAWLEGRQLQAPDPVQYRGRRLTPVAFGLGLALVVSHACVEIRTNGGILRTLLDTRALSMFTQDVFYRQWGHDSYRLSRVDLDRETFSGRGEWSPRMIAGRAGLRAPVFLALFRAPRRQCPRATIPSAVECSRE